MSEADLPLAQFAYAPVVRRPGVRAVLLLVAAMPITAIVGDTLYLINFALGITRVLAAPPIIIDPTTAAVLAVELGVSVLLIVSALRARHTLQLREVGVLCVCAAMTQVAYAGAYALHYGPRYFGPHGLAGQNPYYAISFTQSVAQSSARAVLPVVAAVVLRRLNSDGDALNGP